MKFYTNVSMRGNSVTVRGWNFGQRFQDTIKYEPTLYVPVRKETGYKTVYGQHVEPIKLESIREAREYEEKYKDIENFKIYGSTLYQYCCLNERFGNDYDQEKVRVLNIDIEVASADGFPDPDVANQPVISVTISYNGNYIVLGVGDYVNSRSDVRYVSCRDEKDLLEKFLISWRKLDPDIITGWNVLFFDIPYLVNRMEKILGQDETKRLSPLLQINEKKVFKHNRDQTEYELVGIEILDYLELYRKFTYTQQESYRLDHIAFVELGERKLDYSEVDNLHQLYLTDYQKFIDYNIKDVELVDKLEDKMKLIEMALAIAYDAKVNYKDVFTQVRMWDVLIHNYLLSKKVVVPPKTNSSKNAQYAGAYVKEPQVGMHNWVMSFDLNSLYPHLIMQYNISPDTFIEGQYKDVVVEDLIAGKVPEYPVTQVLTANGYLYDRNKQGFLPEMMQKMYDDRVIYKKKMIEAQSELEEVNRQNSKDVDRKKQLVKDISKYKNMQMAKKVQLNSAYGAIGNQYFRFFDIRMAESITLSGQLSIKWIESRINVYMNNLLKTKGVDYVIASDTDSLYITFDELVSQVMSKGSRLEESQGDASKVVGFLDRVAREKIEPFIDKSYQDLALMMNAYDQKMFMKREAIASKGIWTAKKRYILNVFDNEGVRYASPKLKMMGIETVKSSTPAVCRDALKEALEIIMNKGEDEVQDYISVFEDKFRTLPFEDVAFPRGVSDMSKYESKGKELEIPKGCPIHVRGALVYNHLLKEHKLTKRYETIKDGEKIKFCYLKTPNPVQQNVLSVMSSLPKQFGVENYIDYGTQFEKTFLDPLKIILQSIGWKAVKENTLEDFFS